MWSPPRGPSWILRRLRTSWWWSATWGCLIPWASESKSWFFLLIWCTYIWNNVSETYREEHILMEEEEARRRPRQSDITLQLLSALYVYIFQWYFINANILKKMIWFPQLNKLKCIINELSNSWLSLDPFLVSKTFYFTNRGFHVQTTRKHQNLRIIVKIFEAACWEIACWGKP